MKVMMGIMVVLQLATLAGLYLVLNETADARHYAINNEIEWEIHRKIVCDTYGSDHPLCGWRRKELEAAE